MNLQNLLQHTNLKDPTANGASISPTTGSVAVVPGSATLLDVVEPPKFITARHVTAVFEKLGYDGDAGQKVFNILCEALARVKRDALREGQENSVAATSSSQQQQSLPAAPSGVGPSPATPPPPRRSENRNSALAAAWGEDEDDDENNSADSDDEAVNMRRLAEQQEIKMKKAREAGAEYETTTQQNLASPPRRLPAPAPVGSGAIVAPSSSKSSSTSAAVPSTSSAAKDIGGFASPLYSSAAVMARTRGSSGQWQSGGAMMNGGVPGAADASDVSPSATATPNPPAAGGAANHKMDVHDFIHAIELDDIFLQVCSWNSLFFSCP